MTQKEFDDRMNELFMTDEEMREQAIGVLVGLLREMPFTVDYVVKRKPSGIKVTIEMTREMEAAMRSGM